MSTKRSYRLEGLESDNLLAFLALLGLLRSLEAVDAKRAEEEKLWPRASWDLKLEEGPVRPVLHVKRELTQDEIAEAAAEGLALLAEDHRLKGVESKDLNFTRTVARDLLEDALRTSSQAVRGRADLLASLMSDGAVKEDKSSAEAPVDPTPLCLLFGQGHQHFLERLRDVPLQAAPPPRGRGKAAVTLTPAQCLEEALFAPWQRSDPTFSFRWDPEEDVRYALLAGDPAAPAYKAGTQHGANRLAAVGLATLMLAPRTREGWVRRVRPSILGGEFGAKSFSFAWPIWKAPATLAAIQAMLGHPSLREPGALAHLGVEHVLVAERIPVGKFMNFSRGRVNPEGVSATEEKGAREAISPSVRPAATGRKARAGIPLLSTDPNARRVTSESIHRLREELP